jgi:hypothetical protein
MAPAEVVSQDVILDATGQTSLDAAISWISDDHPLERNTDMRLLLRALLAHAGDHVRALDARRRLARALARSELDSAAILFKPDTIVPAERFRKTLLRLAKKCSDNSLAKITSSAVIAAQREDAFTIETLCAVAGLSYNELSARVQSLPARPRSRWTPSQIRRAFEVVDDLVRGAVKTDLPGAVPARALELMASTGADTDGWDGVEKYRADGVPYEVLLAQRTAGGAWLAHRNRTSGKFAPLLADRLCQELAARDIDFRRSAVLGGDVAPTRMSELSGCDKQIGLLALGKSEAPAYGVIFSTARDSGTASKNVGRLRAMRRSAGLPIAIVVAGPGWAVRNETADLAAHFEGRLYSERALGVLADDIARTTKEGEDSNADTNE